MIPLSPLICGTERCATRRSRCSSSPATRRSQRKSARSTQTSIALSGAASATAMARRSGTTREAQLGHGEGVTVDRYCYRDGSPVFQVSTQIIGGDSRSEPNVGLERSPERQSGPREASSLAE